jgi:two-component system sensor histidine kinase KdpD
VEDLIGAALEQLGAGARRREIAVDIARDLPPVPMDFVLIVQVLVNIVDNALKYSAPNTPIRIAARLRANALEIAITDDGEGIQEKDLPHIFDKFNRAGRTGETGGIGLGLSISRSLVEAHRGAIWAERRNPRGTRVIFRLPLSAAVKGACQ